MFVRSHSEKSADPVRIEKLLVVEQVMTDAVGFLSGVKGSPDLSLAPSASPLFGMMESVLGRGGR